jgi:membrane-associated phospholipid phosphatase
MTDPMPAIRSRTTGTPSRPTGDAYDPSPMAVDDHDLTGRALSRLVVVTLTVYLLVMVAIVTVRGVWVTPDVLAVFIALGAILIGRGVLFIRDWLPFVAILLAWEAMRGLADGFGMAVHSDDVIAVEQLLFFGSVPTVILQEAFFRAGTVAWYDVFLSLLYGAHFAFPIVIAWVFWLRDRGMYFRFVASLMIMALAGFVLYVLIPVAPPRFSADYGSLNLGIHDVMKETLTRLDQLPLASWTYANISPNPVAAFPSLHAAFPVLAFLFVRRRFPRVAIGVALYTALMWYAIVYLGHHYVVDIIGGVALAVGTYWLVIHRGLLDRALDRLVGGRSGREAQPA